MSTLSALLLFADVQPASSSAGLVTAIATVITALGGLVLAVGVLIPILRNSKANLAQTEKIHTIVNQQRTDAQRYNIALTEVLRRNGIEIPIDQSLPVPGRDDAQPGQPTDS